MRNISQLQCNIGSSYFNIEIRTTTPLNSRKVECIVNPFTERGGTLAFNNL